MRIIAGLYKGCRLQTFTGNDIRPTPGKVREAIFDIIGVRIVGAEFLDLFAGTGAMGIEAISRGAKGVTFVEIDRKSIALIKNNLTKIKKNEVSNIIKTDYRQALKLFNLNQKSFNIIFLDPPYHKNYISIVLQEVDISNILPEGSLIIVQHPTPIEVKGDFKNLLPIKEKKYGSTKITILKKL